MVGARSSHCLAAVEGSMMLSLLEDLCRRDVRPKMWRPPAFECGDPCETLTKARSGGGGRHPTMASRPVISDDWGFDVVAADIPSVGTATCGELPRLSTDSQLPRSFRRTRLSPASPSVHARFSHGVEHDAPWEGSPLSSAPFLPLLAQVLSQKRSRSCSSRLPEPWRMWRMFDGACQHLDRDRCHRKLPRLAVRAS